MPLDETTFAVTEFMRVAKLYEKSTAQDFAAGVVGAIKSGDETAVHADAQGFLTSTQRYEVFPKEAVYSYALYSRGDQTFNMSADQIARWPGINLEASEVDQLASSVRERRLNVAAEIIGIDQLGVLRSLARLLLDQTAPRHGSPAAR